MQRLALAAVLVSCVGCLPGSAPRPVDAVDTTGFALYRSGRFGTGRLEELCRTGLREIVVLDGTARRRECRRRAAHCPELRVRLDASQRAEVPLSEAFLVAFDRWVEESRAGGVKILFRCQSGWHRSGRLAAYYQMKHQAIGVEEAKARMNEAGKFMWRHRELEPQVEALWDHIQGRPCSVAEEFCVRADGGSEPGPTVFPEDVCATE